MVWTPIIKEILHLEAEDNNQHDKYAASVMKNDQIVGRECRIPLGLWQALKNGGR